MHRLTVRVLMTGSLLVLTAGIVTTGISSASSSSDGGVKACVDGHDHLSLLKHGKCKSGSNEVTIGQRGAPGPQGPAGSDASPPSTFQDFGNVDAEGDLGSNNGVKSVQRSNEFVGPLYTVTFDNSIVGCSVLAVAGEVAGTDQPKAAFPVITPLDTTSVAIGLFQPTSQGATTTAATPFMVTATCTNVIHVQ